MIKARLIDSLMAILGRFAFHHRLSRFHSIIHKHFMHQQLTAAKHEMAKRNAHGAISLILKAGTIAEQLGDATALNSAGRVLMQLGKIERGWQLQCSAQRHDRDCALPEWTGDDLSARTLLIRPARSSSIGKAIRYARFIEPALQKAKRCIILAEPRMVPILRRTFPALEVRCRDSDAGDVILEADVAATFETLGKYFAGSESSLQSSLVTLRADPEKVACFREQYRGGSDAALVGISWWSVNGKKDLPDIGAWSGLLGRTSTTFVSLQYPYDGFTRDLERLRSVSVSRIIHDETVDQFAEIDDFAAQVVALDAVVTVSNTTVHVAGDFNVPTILLREDNAYGMWPISGATPWYPDMTIIYRHSRPWSLVLTEAKQYLDRILAPHDPSYRSEIFQPALS
jgi:hypothetical protein